MQLPPLVKATLIKRYQRFLADVVLQDNGETVTVYCPNTGAMTGCDSPGATIWLSVSDNPKRKYRYTWELLQTPQGDSVCIHSARANALVHEAIAGGVIAELGGYDSVRTEVRYGDENSRIDLLLESASSELAPCFVEVKSVTLLGGENRGLFPDAPSARGRKHLRELTAMVAQGHRAVLLFAVLHSGIESVAPAALIDPQYANVLTEAHAGGVEVLAYGASIEVDQITLSRPLPFILKA